MSLENMLSQKGQSQPQGDGKILAITVICGLPRTTVQEKDIHCVIIRKFHGKYGN